MEFSAKLVLSSNLGYSKKRVSFFQSVSAYWHALLSALEGNAISTVWKLALASGLCQAVGMAKKRTKADRLERQIEQLGKEQIAIQTRSRKRTLPATT
jgi:hypothetical protein